MAATCRICLDDRVPLIDEQIQHGVPLTKLAKEFAYPRTTLADHRKHAILLRGQFDRDAVGQSEFGTLSDKLSKGYKYAARWKNGSLYAACLSTHGQLVRSLLRLDQAPDKPEQQQLPHTRLPKLDIRKQAEIILQTVPEPPPDK